MSKVSAFLVTYLELLLAAMSLPVVACIHLLISSHFENPWKVTAAAALSVGVLHGGLAWFVRSRQRNVRLQLLRRAGTILQGQSQTAPAGAARLTDYDVRLASAQLVALVREPLIMKTVPLQNTIRQDLAHGRHA